MIQKKVSVLALTVVALAGDQAKHMLNHVHFRATQIATLIQKPTQLI